MNITNFPFEVISHIFKYLSVSDIKQVRLVCHQWYCASQDPHLLQREVIVFEAAVTRSDMLSFLNSDKNIYHFDFRLGDINWNITEFWDQFGPNLKSLSLDSCDIHERELMDILSRCPRLQSLRLRQCKELLMSGRLFSNESDVECLKSILVSLRELSIENNRYLSDALLNRFFALSLNLESLSLSGCQISFHHALYKRFYPAQSKGNMIRANDDVDSTEVMASTSILTFRNILNHIKNNAKRISGLCFSDTHIDSPALKKLSQVSNLRLSKVVLSACDQLTNAGIEALVLHQKQLEHLDLSHCTKISDPAIITVCRNLSSLKHLSVEKCQWLTDCSISEMHRLNQLVFLNLSQCDQVTNEGIIAGIATASHKDTLKTLLLRDITKMNQRAVVELAKALPNLIVLDLCRCSHAITDVSIQAIFKHQVWLKDLNLDDCTNITDHGLTGMEAVEFPGSSADGVTSTEPPRIFLGSRAEQEILQAARRKMAHAQIFSRRPLFDVCPETSIARLRGLQILSLQGCTWISDVSLIQAFQFLELKSLNLTGCIEISDTGVKCLSENNPSLETLKLDHCAKITDDAISMIANNLKRLKNLALQCCASLTNECLPHFVAMDSLRCLDLKGCSRIDRNTCARLLQDKVRILSLPNEVSGWSGLSPPVPPPMYPFSRLA